MIDVVFFADAVVDFDELTNERDNVPFRDVSMAAGNMIDQPEFLIEFIPPDAFEIIEAVIEELFLKEGTSVIERDGVAGANPLKEFEKRGFGDRDIRVILFPIGFLPEAGGPGWYRRL